MKLLLDTHALLWLVDGDAQLTQPARSAIADPANVLFVSVATIWELAIKTSKANSPLVLSDPLGTLGTLLFSKKAVSPRLFRLGAPQTNFPRGNMLTD